MKTLTHYRTAIWALLQALGPWGVLLMALLDGAGVPLPGAVDAVVVSYVYGSPHNTWLYVLLASAGSALGCLVLYLIGYFGGEVLIQKRMSPVKFEKVRADFEEHPLITVALPAIMPPPFPFKVVVLSAGAFEMQWLHFLAAIFAGRLVRFTALSLLTIEFGPGIIYLFNTAIRRHLGLTLIVVAAVILGFVLAHRFRRNHTRATTSLESND